MSLSTDISELFHHIVQSEEKIKKRFEALKQVNSAIQTAQDELRSTRYESNIVSGKISTLNHKLVQERIHKTWLESCEEILKVQHTDCTNENECARRKAAEKRKYFTERRTTFLSEIDTFVHEQWNLCFKGAEIQHKEFCEDEYKKLLQTQKDAKAKIEECEDEVLRKDGLEEELRSVLRIVEDKTQQCEGLKRALDEEEEQIKDLNSTKHGLAKKISTDEEFQCVLRELEQCKKQCSVASDDHQNLTNKLCIMQRKVQKSRGNPWYVDSGRLGSNPSRYESVGASSSYMGPQSDSIAPNDRGKKRFPYKKTRKMDVLDMDDSVSELLVEEDLLDCGSILSEEIDKSL